MDNSLLHLLRIRHLEQADLPALEWDGEYSHFRRLYREIFEISMKGEAILWVAEIDSTEIVGQLFVRLNSTQRRIADGFSRAYIFSVRVKETYRNQGIGSKLLNIAEADLIGRMFRWSTLNVDQKNPRARRFYERHGYHVVGTDPGRWQYLDEEGNIHHVVEPAWRMEKELLKGF